MAKERSTMEPEKLRSTMEPEKFHIIDFKELNNTESLLMAFEETLRLAEKQGVERLGRENRSTIQVLYVALYRIIRFLIRAAFMLFLFGETFKRGNN